jgi:hypothetical protein
MEGLIVLFFLYLYWDSKRLRRSDDDDNSHKRCESDTPSKSKKCYHSNNSNDSDDSNIAHAGPETKWSGNTGVDEFNQIR